MVSSLKDTVTLHNGVKMPWFGLGVFKVEEGSQVVESVKAAIKTDTGALTQPLSIKMKKASAKGLRNQAFPAKSFSSRQRFGTVTRDMKNIGGF